jgi:GNAT superfamily N-acetyltransferase
MKTFEQFINEAKEAKPDALRTIERKWENRPGHKGLNVYASQKDSHIKLHDLFVPPHLRGKKVGSRIMKGLTKYADRQNASMSLKQAPEKGYKRKLGDFYKRFGFKSNKGRNKDFTTRDTHIRQPNK